MAGRPRKTNQEKIANNTLRPDRDMTLPMSEGIPDAPGYLSPVALTHWDRMVDAAQQARTLTPADGDALAMLCVAFEEWRAADIIVRDEGEICSVERETMSPSGTVKSTKGGAYQHPAVGIRTNAWKKIVKMLREFGLTPNARAGMKMAAKPAEENPIAAMFKAMQRTAGRG